MPSNTDQRRPNIGFLCGVLLHSIWGHHPQIRAHAEYYCGMRPHSNTERSTYLKCLYKAGPSTAAAAVLAAAARTPAAAVVLAAAAKTPVAAAAVSADAATTVTANAASLVGHKSSA